MCILTDPRNSEQIVLSFGGVCHNFMEAFKPMVIVGYSCSRKEPGTGVWRSEILSFQTETRTHREKLVQLTCGGYLLCVRPNAVS